MSDLIRRLRARARALLHRRDVERDLDDELRFHLEMETEYLMRMGLSTDEARRRAQRDFGGVERYRDESRDARGVSAIEDFFRDVRVGARSLTRAPGFAMVSIFTVALGIAATTAVFSIIDGILFRPLPYPRPDQLVRIYERSPEYPASSFAAPNFYDLERVTRTLRAAAYYSPDEATVLGLSQPVRVGMARVSDRFFDVLGVHPSRGRNLMAGDMRASDHPTIVSDRFWRTWLNARPDWENSLLRLDGATVRVVGIMPASFSYPPDIDLWIPLYDDNPHRTSHNWSVLGRLADGRTIDEARAELNTLFGGLKQQMGKDIDAEGVTIRSLREALTLRVKTLCYVLLAAVGLVLLVACTNLASANLARGESQQREIAVRTSLGASRGRLVRQLATEKIILCAVGGVLGIAASWLVVRAAVLLGTGTIPAFANVTVDGRVLSFGLAMALLTGLVTGIVPALRVTSNLRSLSVGGGAGRARSFRSPLIVAEVSLATTLVIGAGLFLRSFQQLMAEDPGYAVHQLVLGSVSLPSAYQNASGWYGDTVRVSRFYSQVLERLRAMPGNQAVALINQIPLGKNSFGTSVAVDGGTEFTRRGIDYRVVDTAYFGAMGIPIVRGRGFTGADRSGNEQVVIVNRAAAEQLWPGQNPIGHRIRPPGMDLHADLWLTVVGVADNVKQDGLDQPSPTQMYVPYLQRPERLQNGTLVVRTSAPQAAISAIRSAVSEADRNVLLEITSMEALLDASVAGRRFSMTMLSAFSVLALFLAAVGIYGVLAYAVVQRQREIGVRMAIGLSRSGVARLIMLDAMKAVAPGLVIGLIGAFLATRFIQGMLFGIAAVDPVTYLVTAGVIVGVGLLASLWPASRASRVDPMIAMRAE
jgi:putative ABC transport system permease protein